MNMMALADREDPNRIQRRRQRVAPIRTPSDAASQIFDLYDAARKGLIPPADAFYLSATLKTLADLRLSETIADSILNTFESRLAELDDRFSVLEALR